MRFKSTKDRSLEKISKYLLKSIRDIKEIKAKFEQCIAHEIEFDPEETKNLETDE